MKKSRKYNFNIKVTLAVVLVLLVTTLVSWFVLQNTYEAESPNSQTFQKSEVKSVDGVVTRIHRDCDSTQYLDVNGAIVSDDRVICDAGSYIDVGSERIRFTSGYTAAKYAFSTDIGDIEPGDTVRVDYVVESRSKTTDCETCGVTKIADR